MQIEITIGKLARRDGHIVAGDDVSISLLAYSSAVPNPVDLDGDVRLVIFQCGYDAASVDGVGASPTIFDLPGAKTRALSGRWSWRIERTYNDTLTTLMHGVLVIDNTGDR